MTVLIAVGERRPLTGAEQHELHQHVITCDQCAELTMEAGDDQLRWVARIPEDALDDADLLVLPTIDPIVFTRCDELARGGMGRITRARDRRLGRDVAIKEVLAPELRARFEREAAITARLQHPAIVPIYEAGAWPDGSAFYTMRLVSGGTLADAMAKAQSLEARLALLPHVVAVTEALGYAHARRVIHRDLKPANVLVGEFGETLVIDWGLAKELGGPDGASAGRGEPVSPELTRAGSVVGTPCFIAPEQAAGDEIDERADVYALGAMLYNLLAGHPPHWDRTEHSAERLLDAARRSSPTPLGELVPRAPADLRAIVERAMAHDRQARYRTAVQLAEELRRFQAGQLLRSREYSARELVARWIRRHRAAVAVGAAAIGVVAVVAAISVQQIVARERETRRALAESQLEQGRQLLLDGEPGQAAPYLAAALDELPGEPVARRLAAMAVRDLTRLLGAFPGVTAAFRRDGGELAIGRADGSIAVIDPATAAVLRTLPPPGPGGEVHRLDWAPDGGSLAVASASGAYLCDAASGLRVVTLGAGPASDVRFAPRGDAVVVASSTALSLVGLDGKPVASDGEVADPHALASSLDGDTLVAVTRAGASAWRASDLSPVASAPAADDHFAAAFGRGDLFIAGMDGVRRWRDGHDTRLVPETVATLVWVDDHTLAADARLIRTDTGEIRSLGHHAVQAVGVIDPRHVIAGGYDGKLRIWDLERLARPVVVLDAATASSMVVVDPTGRRAVSRGRRADTPIELWDVTRLPAPARVSAPLGARIEGIYSDHRERLAVRVHAGAATVTRLMTAGFEPVAVLDGWPVGFRPGRDELVTDRDGRLVVYSSRDGRLLREVAEPEPLWHAAFSPTGAAIATSTPHRVALRDADWRVIASFEVPGEISALAVDDAGRIVTGYSDGALQIWNGHAGAVVAAAAGHAAPIAMIAIQGGELITGSWDLTMRRWAFPSGAALGVVRFDKAVDDVSPSPGGALFAIADGPDTISVWDIAQGRMLERFPALDGLAAAAFVDDDHVAVGGDSGRLELIDVSVPPVTAAEARRRVAAAPRWRLVDGRVVAQPPSEAVR
ncbi:MAG TPA: serine/threonine-protein kinase [Kofleriaceae bacterium]|nr:serine/threonine-protein kinase [Kofleriaceae bacterium]